MFSGSLCCPIFPNWHLFTTCCLTAFHLCLHTDFTSFFLFFFFFFLSASCLVILYLVLSWDLLITPFLSDLSIKRAWFPLMILLIRGACLCGTCFSMLIQEWVFWKPAQNGHMLIVDPLDFLQTLYFSWY